MRGITSGGSSRPGITALGAIGAPWMLLAQSRPAHPAGPRSQRVAGEAWSRRAHDRVYRTSGVVGCSIRCSSFNRLRHLLQYARAEPRAAPAVASAGVRIAQPYLWSCDPCSEARRTWANKAREIRCVPRHLRHRVALKNTSSVPSLPMCRPPSSAAGVPRSSISPSFVRSALPRRLCSSVRDLALPRVHRVAFHSTLRSCIRSKAGWFQSRSNRTRVQKKFSAPTLEIAHVLLRWLAITIPACMLCDMTVNACNAKERR